MPRYRAKSMLFVDGSRIRAGAEFSSDSPPSAEWELIEAANETVKPKAEKAEKQSEPAKPAPLPIDPWEGKTDEQIRDFIDTKHGKQPGSKATREQLIEAANKLVKPETE